MLCVGACMRAFERESMCVGVLWRERKCVSFVGSKCVYVYIRLRVCVWVCVFECVCFACVCISAQNMTHSMAVGKKQL